MAALYPDVNLNIIFMCSRDPYALLFGVVNCLGMAYTVWIWRKTPSLAVLLELRVSQLITSLEDLQPRSSMCCQGTATEIFSLKDAAVLRRWWKSHLNQLAKSSQKECHAIRKKKTGRVKRC